MPIGVYPRKPIKERFWAKVDSADDCWIWTAETSRGGYGRFAAGSRSDGTRRSVQAHRYAYELLVGPIPEGLELDHLCRVRNCVNPAHLEPVTTKVNVLRGIGLAARNAGKTHCPQGHPYDEANTYYYSTGKRACRACRAAYSRICSQAKRKPKPM